MKPDANAPDPASGDDPRVAELERELARARAEIERLEYADFRLRSFLAISLETIGVFEKGRVVDLNRNFEVMFGYTVEEALGRSVLDFIAPESQELILHNIRTNHTEPYEATLLRKGGARFVALIRGLVVEYQGRPLRVTAFADLTEQKRAEEALRETQRREETIHIQSELIARLGAPLLPIGRKALVMPLVGQINAARAGQVLTTLTQGVAAHGAEHAIIDVTGVEALDAPVADLLLGATRALELLGAHVLLTGIRPEVARILLSLERDLGAVTTFATLEQGVAHALGREKGGPHAGTRARGIAKTNR